MLFMPLSYLKKGLQVCKFLAPLETKKLKGFFIGMGKWCVQSWFSQMFVLIFKKYM
jgi:hypothetical protein